MQTSLTQIIARADEFYAERSEIANVRLSVDLLNEAEAYSYEAAWRLARAYFFLGQEAENKDEARSHHSKGVRTAARAVKLRPECVEGHFWLGVSLALLAQTQNSILALRYALRAKRALHCASRIDPTYHDAGPLRVLARVQHKLPRIFGGGRGRARENYEAAIELAPENTVTRIYFAELLWEVGEKNSARGQLETILDTPTNPAWQFETKRDQKLAKERLVTIGT